jgi:hypothetical protein
LVQIHILSSTPPTGWKVIEIRAATFLNRVAQPAPAIAAFVEKLTE